MDIDKLKEFHSLVKEASELVPSNASEVNQNLRKMVHQFRGISVTLMEGLDIRSDLKNVIPANKLGEFYTAVREIHGTTSFSLDKATELRNTLNTITRILDETIKTNSKSQPSKKNNSPLLSDSKQTWDRIQREFDFSKIGFGKKLNFIDDSYKRKIIIRDTEQAYILSKNDFSKPAVILAGGIIEELLRLYLASKRITHRGQTFDSYISECENNNLLKKPISKLLDSIRHFRNYVHLDKEKSKKDSVSKSIASSAVASIFTIVDSL